jgi:type I restriction enzyme, S subunit
MRKGWITTPLSDVAAVQSGAGFPDRYQGQADRAIPLYKVSDMNIAGNEREMIHENNSITETVRRELGAFLFPKGSTIFPKIGGAIATNKKRLTTRDCCVDNNVMGVIPRPGKIDSELLFYFFLAHDLSEFANEAHLPSIKKTVVEAWPITLPATLAEQQRIVGILDEAFNGIATAKANAEKNLQNSRAIFDSHLQAVFTQRGKGWVKATIGDVCMLKSGTTVPVAIERPNGDMPYVKVAEMTMPANSEGVTTSIRFLNQSDIKPVWIIPAGAVIFPKRGGAILTNKKRLALVDMCADLNIMSVIPTDKLTPEFLYMYFLTVDMRTLGTGSSIPQINNYDIAPLPISFPELKKEQIEVTEALQTIRTECKALAAIYERKVAALEGLKKSLLHQAFSGNL